MQAGSSADSGLVAEVDRRLGWAGFLANGVGGLIVFLFLALLFPTTLEEAEVGELQLRAAIATAVLMAITLPLGRRWSHRDFLAAVEWMREGGEADQEERRRVLRYPWLFTRIAGRFWALGAGVGWLIGIEYGLVVAELITVSVALGGVTACALQYLLVERLMRPITAAALAGGDPPSAPTPGVATRITMSWVLATGVPLLGVLAMGLWDLLGDEIDAGDVIGATTFLAGLALVVGLAVMRITAGSVADPLASLREAVQRVEQGRFDSRVPVDDGSEVGRLQASFNRMATGLGERERLHEAFGAYVDPDLADRVLSEGTDLEGEEVEVSILFIDVRDFTSLSERVGAREVVARLNELYEEVVPVIQRHKGHANKFIGDGLLAVFGAPDRLEDHAQHAVDAALEVAAVVGRRFGEQLRVGVGVNTGKVMAGSIGGGGRLDFTVIGDTVNTAARVEAATRQTGDEVLITGATLDHLPDREGWSERERLQLKGKTEQVRLYGPSPVPAAAG